MGRGPKPAKSKEAKPPVARRSPKSDGGKVRDLEKRLAEAEQREAEALKREAATSEVLRVIASSPTDTQPVFDAIAESARRLLRGWGSLLVRFDGRLLHAAAISGGASGSAEVLRERFPIIAERGTDFVGDAVLDREVKVVEDIEVETRWPGMRGRARTRGWRAIVAVPMFQDGQPIGGLTVTRTEPGPFGPQDIALLQTFAAQAVIAIDNVRLFNETKEALEQQTATAEILSVISQSPTDVQPVFDAIAASGSRLCGGVAAIVTRFDGEMIHLVAHHNRRESVALRTYPRRPGRDTPTARAILECSIVHVPDAEQDADLAPGLARDVRAGSFLAVPMLRDAQPIGAISVSRVETGPFPLSQIELLKTFADQAVIAIENVRLFTELQEKNRALTQAHAEVTETLEQLTATSEILRVMSSSPTDIQPVLNTVAASSARLCEAQDTHIYLVDGDVLRLAAHHGSLPSGVIGESTLPLIRGTLNGRAVIERRVAQIADLQNEVQEFPEGAATARRYGHRTALIVPLLREGIAIGTISLRRAEVRLFSERQVALLQTFADQAVIAIENVRLFTELQEKNGALTQAHAQVTESLEQQTATSEILRVISTSPANVQPVFEAIVRASSRLCDSPRSNLMLTVGDHIELAARCIDGAVKNIRDLSDPFHSAYPMPIEQSGLAGIVIRAGRTFVTDDAQHDARFSPARRAAATEAGFHSLVGVPMMRGQQVIGALNVARTEIRPYTVGEIQLLETFANQAVIAIENVRLFKELEARNAALTESLEQQTATSELLRVISSSPTDVQPVFEAIVRSAVRLCNARFANIFRLENDVVHLAAHHNVPVEALEHFRHTFPQPLSQGGTLTAQAMRQGTVVHIHDVEAQSDVAAPVRALTRSAGYRTVLAVPILRPGNVVGAIGVGRSDVTGAPWPFSDKEIALLKTFADQAVIAIENVRLFKELQTSNRELTTALDKQTATSDILRVISRSQTNVQPVFDAIVASAVRLLGAYTGALTQIAGDQIELAALTSTDDAGDAATRARFPQSLQSEGANAQAIRDRAPINIADAQTDPRTPEAGRATARARGYRSQVVVPLLRHDEAVGTITVSRREPGGFTDDEIALLKTFADQAVIAIENARLLTELQARTQELTRSVDQLTALGDVGRAVSSSLDLETVLNTIVARAVQLAGAHSGTIWEYDAVAEEFVLRITQNVEDPELRANSNARVRRGEGAVGRLAISRQPVQIPDITHEGAYQGRLRDSLMGAGTRALLAIPLLHEDQLLGGLVISRRTPGEFRSEVVDLLASFATQSALALQNARLFLEIEDKSRQLEAASQHKSEFLANMSHELRTPLNAIIGFSEVLSEKMFGELNEKQEEYSKDIHASGQHLLSLINDILDLSKIEAGRMELELSDFHLPMALDSALTLVRERTGRRSIALHLSVDERLGQIQADERKIRQVVLNLLSNAIKFTPEGGRIDVKAMPKDAFVEVSVSDTGVGIAPEDQEVVFEEFRQVGTADKKVEGTGLGLTLCRKFVELHGGKIWVKSEVGVGSTFTFSLPLSNS